MEPKKARVNIRLDPHLYHALKEMSHRDNVSQTSIVEEGLRRVINGPPAHLPKKGSHKRQKRSQSVSEAVLGRTEEELLEARVKELAKKLPKPIARRIATEEFKSK